MNIWQNYDKKILFPFLVITLAFTSACSSEISANTSETRTKKVIRVAIGTQDQVINTATGGSVIREEKLLEKHLPKSGKYQNVEYKIEWSSYTSGPPITNKMLANQIDIGMMGDFPAAINMTTFHQKGAGVKTLYIATLAYSPTGAGNAVVVPKNSPIRSLSDLKGAEVSVPFGSAAHGMLLKALKNSGVDPEQEVKLISQSPEVGGTSLRTNQIDAHADFVPFGELFPFRGYARKIFDGAQTNVPTLHGVVVRSDFAQQYPEIVVAYLKALLEANRLFREQPEAVASKIEDWTGVEREVVYMFIGPSGLQKIDPTIRQVQVNALKNSITTLKELGKLDASVNPNSVTQWIDESYLQKALKETGLDYNQVVSAANQFLISGADFQTQEPIQDPKKAAQIWIQNEKEVMNFASVKNMLLALQKLKAKGKQPSAIYVQDYNSGLKLLAENSFFVHSQNDIFAFLTEQQAQTYATQNGAQVANFKGLQDVYALRAQFKGYARANK